MAQLARLSRNPGPRLRHDLVHPPDNIPSLREWLSRVEVMDPTALKAKLARNRQAYREKTIESLKQLESAAAQQEAPAGSESPRLGLLAVTIDGQVSYPSLQFQADGTPYPQMTGIIEAIHAGREPELIRDGLEAAGWFFDKTGLLSGQRPVDVLPNDPDRVLKAARREFARWLREQEQPKSG